jgi:hypothetical protein
MSLKSRLDRMERSPHFRPRVVVISAESGRGEPSRSVKYFPNGSGFHLSVPPEFRTDPKAGLDNHQKGMLKPDDKLLLIVRRDCHEPEIPH